MHNNVEVAQKTTCSPTLIVLTFIVEAAGCFTKREDPQQYFIGEELRNNLSQRLLACSESFSGH